MEGEREEERKGGRGKERRKERGEERREVGGIGKRENSAGQSVAQKVVFSIHTSCLVTNFSSQKTGKPITNHSE